MVDLRTLATDPDFQGLDPEEQRKAFIENDQEFASLPKEEQDKGMADLLKSVTTRSQSSISEVPRATLETTANLAGMAARFTPPVFVPWGISKGMEAITGSKLLGAPARLIERATEVEPRTETGKNVMGAISAPFQKWHEFGEKAADVVTGAGQKLGLPPEIAAIPGTTVGSAIQFAPYALGARYTMKNAAVPESAPLAGVMNAPVSELKSAAAREAEYLAKRAYGSAVKMPLSKKWIKELPGEEVTRRSRALEKGLEERIPPNELGIQKATNLEEGLRSGIDYIVSEARNPGRTIPIDQVVDTGLKSAYEAAMNSSKPIRALMMVDRIAKEFKLGRPEDLTLQHLNQIKRQLYKESSWTGNQKTGLHGELNEMAVKGLSNAAKQLLEKRYPQLKNMNWNEGALIDLKEALERAFGRISQRDLIPIKSAILYRPSTWLALLAEATIEHPAIKSRIGFALHGIAKGFGQKSSAPPYEIPPEVNPMVPPGPPLQLEGPQIYGETTTPNLPVPYTPPVTGGPLVDTGRFFQQGAPPTYPKLDWWRGPGAEGVEPIPGPEGPTLPPGSQNFTMKEPGWSPAPVTTPSPRTYAPGETGPGITKETVERRPGLPFLGPGEIPPVRETNRGVLSIEGGKGGMLQTMGKEGPIGEQGLLPIKQEIELAQEALSKGVSREKVAKKFKQRTGQDLPKESLNLQAKGETIPGLIYQGPPTGMPKGAPLYYEYKISKSAAQKAGVPEAEGANISVLNPTPQSLMKAMADKIEQFRQGR